MPGTSASVLATELERVETKIPILFDRDSTFFSQIEKRPGEIVSEIAMRQPLEISPGGTSGHWSSDGGDMGVGGLPFYDKAEINTVEYLHRLAWTTRRKWATDSTRKAVVNAFRRDLASGMKEMRRNVDSLIMTAGNGVLGTITNVTTNTPVGSDTITLTTDGFGARLLRKNNRYNIWDPTLTILRNATGLANEPTITYYDLANKTIQVSPSNAAYQNGDLIVSGGLPMQVSPPISFLGVPYHHSNSSTGTWLGFNRATTPEIRANRVAAGGVLALQMPRLALNKVGDRVGIDNTWKGAAWMHPCQVAAYEELGQEVIRIDKSAKEEGLNMYFNDNMQIAGAPMRKSYSWDKTRIDFVDYSVWGRAEFYPAQWYKDENGNRYFVQYGTSGGISANNLAYIVCSFNTYVNNPAACTYIDTLTVPSGY